MIEYDLAFSMGFGCGCSRSLRMAGLQRASFPFDWVGSPGVAASATALASGFKGWFDDREALSLIDVRRGFGVINRAYVDKRTGFIFAHDFHHDYDVGEAFDAVAEKYARRILRLKESIRSSRRVLAVYVEHPIRSRVADETIVHARQMMADAFPGVDFTLLYVYDCDSTDSVEKSVGEGVVTLGMRIRRIEFGLVSHTFYHDPLVRYLAAHARVPDRRTDEEKRRFRESVEAKRAEMDGGGGLVAKWWTRVQRRLHSRLEKRLREKGLLPIDRPFWF